MFAKIVSAGATDIGQKRSTNQDHFLIADLNKSMLVQATSLQMHAQSRLYGMSHGKLFMVADGMGGHSGGDRASALALDLLIAQLLNSMHWFFQVDIEREDREQDFIRDLRQLIQRAHAGIEREAHADLARRGMGTTLTMAYVIWPWMYVVHAGDSRCYLVRDGVIERLTRDHTISNQLMEQGGMTPAEAEQSKWSNVLYNALGAGGEGVEPEIRKVNLRPEDTILLCTDGLYRYVNDEELLSLLSSELDPEKACRELIDTANARGGADNITVVIGRLTRPDASQPKTREAAEITLERLLGEMTGYDNQASGATTSEFDPVSPQADTDPG
ncbi:MAG: serine/threonine-protein phosphatase [Planctomycetota bacterium]|nr:MAG: serine/threonine-protein phosphatase [Planctomycetota bacterium]